jgi:hypothetical protein
MKSMKARRALAVQSHCILVCAVVVPIRQSFLSFRPQQNFHRKADGPAPDVKIPA